MPRDEWRKQEDDPFGRAPDREDFGQADRSTDNGDDPRLRAGYRADEDLNPRPDDRPPRRSPEGDGDNAGRPSQGEAPRLGAPRSWMERAGDFLSGASRPEAPPRRRRPSDRVLWAVIVERLKDERHLDLRDVDVIVEDGEVTLNGAVKRKEDKRRIEDVADIDGVRNVQNNLRVRVRDRDPWTFL